MGRQDLTETTEEKDIGLTIGTNLKLSAQCAKSAKPAQAVLGQSGRAFHYQDHHIFMPLYEQYVRQHIDFMSQAWSS
jgi:hypothetical protein